MVVVSFLVARWCRVAIRRAPEAQGQGPGSARHRGQDVGGSRNRTGDVQLGKLAVPRCAVMACEKNREVARDTMRRRHPA
jgi:hypothetical protein